MSAERAVIASRLAEVRERIDAAAGGRNVLVVGVTKAFGPELWAEATAAGLTDLGENYAQEVEAKVAATGWDRRPPGERPRIHFIGGLQRNKVKRLAPVVHLWQTIDRGALIDALASRVPGARMLVQVNTTGEDQKSGCRPGEVEGLVERAIGAGLEVRGLMTVGPTDPDLDPRPGFAGLRALADRLDLPEVSMGMSGDFEMAVAEGATMVRLGSVLFGARPAPAQRPSPAEPSPTSGGVGK